MYPAGLYGKVTDVYAATDHMVTSGRIRVGMQYWDAETGKTYKICKAGAAIAAGKAIMPDPSDSGLVIPTAAVGDPLEGVNETGQTVASGSLFFATIRGDVTVLVAASQDAGTLLTASATSGQLAAAAEDQIEHIRCTNLAASGAGGATACRLF